MSALADLGFGVPQIIALVGILSGLTLTLVVGYYQEKEKP